MKKFVVAILMMAILLSSAFAYSNEQKIYSVDSGVYEAMEKLYILAGQSLPSTSGPWSEAELQMMLGRIDKADLSKAAQKYYDYVESMITSEPKIQFEDNMAMEFGAKLALEGYYHTNPDFFTDYDDWFHSFTYRNPPVKFTFETWPTDNFYGYFEITAGNNIGDQGINPLYQTQFTINIPLLDSLLFTKDGLLDNFDWSFPARAFGATGGEHWSLMAGRDKLSWGNGETGNLMFSDSFPVHTLARFNTFFDKFKYSMVGTIYPLAVANQDTSMNGYKAMLVHRLEFSLFKNKVGFIVNEACMFWSDPSIVDNGNSQTFNLALVNPFGFMHNEYNRRNGNSLLVFEANYTPIKGVNVYGQVAVDEFNGPGEGKVNPAAFGFIAGVKGALAAGDGIVDGSIEFVKTDPYLYIRGFTYKDDHQSGYGYDAIYRTFKNTGLVNRRMFTTYKYGNDVIIVDGKAGYEMAGIFKVNAEVMYMLHGSMDVNSPWGWFKENENHTDETPVPTTPTTYNVFDPADYSYGTEANNYSDGYVINEQAVEKSLVLSLSGEYYITKSLTATLAADYLIVANRFNVQNSNENDFQLTFGIKYEI